MPSNPKRFLLIAISAILESILMGFITINKCLSSIPASDNSNEKGTLLKKDFFCV